jgi:hypothetical protein
VTNRVNVEDFRRSACYRAIAAITSKSLGEAWATPGLTISPEACTSDQQHSMAIYYAHPGDKPERKFFGLRQGVTRRRYLCQIWFENAARKAHPGHWVVEAYGAEHLEFVTELIEALTGALESKATVHLKTEEVKLESLASDFTY